MSEETQSILVIEDGSIVENANSYVELSFVDNYHKLRGNNEWNDSVSPLEKEQAVIRATQALDSLYMCKWLGEQSDPLKQSLQFPRKNVKVDGSAMDSNVIPSAIKNAVCEFALKELVTPNGLLADLERNGDIRRIKADTVEVEYQKNASNRTAYQKVDGIVKLYVSGTSTADVGTGDVKVNY